MTTMSTARHPRSNDDVHAAVAGQTVPALFAATVADRGDEPAIRWQHGEHWRTWTWRDYAEQAARVAAGFAARGIGRGDTVALMLCNRAEFHAADMGAHLVGATPFSIYNTSPADQVAYLFGHAEARIAIVEGAFADTIMRVRDQLPALEEVIVVTDDTEVAPHGLTRFADVIADTGPVDLATAATVAEPDDLATLIYTSGTTGPPKAVMLTHGNICWVLESFIASLGDPHPGCRMVSYLPMAHLLERLLTQYLPVRNGTVVTPCPDATALGRYLTAVRPEIFVAPPRVWEKLRSALLTGEVPGDQAAAAVGLDECLVAMVGAAPSPAGLIDYFRDLGVPLSEAYGLSETSGLVSAETTAPKLGSVGRPAPGCEIRLLADGEICCRGGNIFAGYYKDPERTAEVLDEDGWFRTGDVGAIDDGGYLRLIDRKKELIITAGGKNISPANLEAALKQIPLIGQACVVGDGRPYLTALLVLDPPACTAWAQRHNLAALTIAELAEHPRLRADIDVGLADVNARLSRVEQIKKFHLLVTEWLPDSECLTPTMKLKRRGVHSRFAAEIDALYADNPEPAMRSASR